MYLRLNTNSTCNLDCIHCYYKKKVGFDGKIMPLSQAKKIINEAYDIFGDELKIVIMGGGEPFLYPYIYELIEYVRLEKNISTSITTNALLLKENDLIKLKNLGVLLNISLEGNEEYNDTIRGKGTFKKILKNIILAHNIGTRASINFTLTKNNLYQIPYLVKLLKNKVEYITFSRYIPYIKNDFMKELDKEDYLALKKILEIYKNDSNLRHRQEIFLNDFKKIKKTYDFDIKKIKSLYILPDGGVYPAWNLINYKIGNINENSLLKILNNKRLESLYNPDNLNGSFCNKCKYKYNCSGDRGVALFYTDNIFGDDIQCPFYKNK